MSEPVLVFTHIPKAAGSTMVAIICSEFGERQILIRGRMKADKWTAQLGELRPGIRAIVGHSRYGVHRHVPVPCRYFTILRDPVERAISLYSYIRNTPAHPCHADVMSGRLGLVDYSRRKRDIQTKYVAGSTAAGAEVIDDAELDRARHHLEFKYEAFGLAEEFAKSVLLFTQAFGWKLRGYRSRNVTPDRIARATLAPDVLDGIRSVNELDLQLHEFARQLFHQRVAAQPPEFERQLEALRRNSRIAHGVDFLKRAIGIGQ